MYINYSYLYENELTDEDLSVLIKIKQKEHVLLEAVDDIEEKLEWLESKKFIQFTKTPKDRIKSVRISKEGNRFLKNLEKPQYQEEYGELAKELIDMYETEDKFTGNKTSVEKRLIWFICESGFSVPVVKKAVSDYLLLADPSYVMSLENLIWKPANVYSTNMKLTESRLYNEITRAHKLDETTHLSDKRKEIKWLKDLSQLEVPKKIDTTYYLTGDYKKDIELLGEIKKKFVSLLRNG